MTLFDVSDLAAGGGICGALGQAITGFSRGGLPRLDSARFCRGRGGYVVTSNV